MSMILNRLASALLLAGLSSVSLAASPETTAPKAPAPLRTYLIQLVDLPAASYAGGTAGLVATRPLEGQRLDANAPAVQRYRSHLGRQQDQVLAALGGQVRPLHRYQIAFNGFSVRLTEAQVRRLKGNRLVRNIATDTVRKADTVSTATFLGLDGSAGLWAQQRKGTPVLGEDIVIAAIDTGVQPENPAFFDQVDAHGTPVATGGTLAYGPAPAQWKGGCVAAPAFPASVCNNKLIGAKVFNSGWLASGGLPWFGTFSDSPRDEDGHGSHTLSTAGGNALAPAHDSRGAYLGTTSGMAPRARVAAYKALFRATTPDGVFAVGMTSDLVAAVEAAVADGADVINYSVSGDTSNLIDPVELAFLGASDANVFVAAAAGNSGMPYTIGHPAPWLTTVAATTHDRNPYAKLTLGNGFSYSGASINTMALPAAPMVLAQAVAAPGVSAEQANWCAAGSLDPTKAAGKVVVCDRGGIITRVDKGTEVKRVGGVGMVLLNTTEPDLKADWQLVPSVHLPAEARELVRSYAAGSSATASIGARYQVAGLVAPIVADFSSRGPNAATTSVLKPDISAPGAGIIASYAYLQKNQAENYALRDGSMVPFPVAAMLDGTSMATPHVAGLAALLKQKRPGWSPSAIKSALMTTAGPVKLADGSTDMDPSGMGAGQANATAAADPGLVYAAFHGDYIRFLCREGWYAAGSTECDGVNVSGAMDSNQPSIAATLIGSHTAHRRVTNVGGSTATYTATANVPGFDVVVTPASLTLAKGEQAEFDVKFTRTTAPFNSPVNGELIWADGSHRVRSPVQLTVVELQAPMFITSGSLADSQSFAVQYGFSGPTSTAKLGLNPSVKVSGQSPYATYNCSVDAFTVTQGTSYVRTSLDAADVNIDIAGLYMWYSDANGGFYGFTHREGNALVLDMKDPAPGDYTMCFWPFESPPSGTPSMTAYRTLIGPAHAPTGQFEVTGLPTGKAKAGRSYTAVANWSGLTSDQRYLGVVQYLRGDGTVAGSTYVNVVPGAASLVRAGHNQPAQAVRTAKQIKAQALKSGTPTQVRRKLAAQR